MLRLCMCPSLPGLLGGGTEGCDFSVAYLDICLRTPATHWENEGRTQAQIGLCNRPEITAGIHGQSDGAGYNGRGPTATYEATETGGVSNAN